MKITDRGSGPAVLLLHGTPSAASDFDPLVAALESSHRVLVPELPGYGRSPALEQSSLDRVERLLLEALRTRDIRRVFLVGFSGGAYRALRLALREELSVERIVTLGGLAGFTPEHRAGLSGLARECERMGGGWDRRWCTEIASTLFFGPGFAQAHPEAVPKVVGWFEATTPAALTAELDTFVAAPDLYEAIAARGLTITARVGSADAAAPVSYSEAIVRAAANGVLQVVPGCGHALLLEDRENTVRAVAEALG